MHLSEDLAEHIRASRELEKKGGQQSAPVLFLSVFEIKVIVGKGRQSGLSRVFKVGYN